MAEEKKEILTNVTTEGIAQWFGEQGYPLSVGLSVVHFQYEEENWSVYTDALPMVTIVKRYNVSPEDYDMTSAVVPKVQNSGRLVHVLFDPEDEEPSIVFAASWMEPDMEHLKAVFKMYIDAIDNACGAMAYYADKYKEDKEKEDAYIRFPLEKEE